MLDERYSIEVGEDTVEIYGYLNIEETFDFLNFFEKKGFVNIAPGHQNSAIRMIRKNEEDRRADQLKMQRDEEDETYKFLLKKEEERHKQTQQRLLELESLIRNLCIKPEMGCSAPGSYVDTSAIHRDPMEIPNMEGS